jgi:hypothetical protein
MAWWTSNSVLVAAALAPAIAVAEPLRLRGDALASVQAPAGLMTLEGSDRTRPWVEAEASVWFGAGDDTQANALVVAVKLSDRKRRASLRLGRQVVTAGALRPVHFDGGDGVLQLSRDATVEAFGGIPVVPSWGPRSWDWVAGARTAATIGDGQVGLAWMQQRDHGELATHELAADGAFALGKRVDLGAGAAFDMIDIGLAEARLSLAARGQLGRIELFANHRAPSHLLPATSLFSVLGDVPATRTGATARWRAAPRLDVDATAAVRISDETGIRLDEDLSTGARLRLDDRGVSSLGLELRREGAPDGGWTGGRAAARIALADAWATSGEFELAIPDDPRGRGDAWPWALAAVTWRPDTGWEVAGAVEASATPQYRSRVDALVRLSRAWDVGAAAAPKRTRVAGGVP